MTREEKTEKENFHPLVYFLNGHINQDWTIAEYGMWMAGIPVLELRLATSTAH